MSFRPRTANVAALALVGLLGLTGCRSQPSQRRVVLDLIESIDTLPAEQEQCMKDKLGDYSNDDLEQIANDNDALDFTQENYVESGSELYQQFVEDMRSCETGAAVTETTGGGGAETTEASDNTEAAETTAPETTVPETTEA